MGSLREAGFEITPDEGEADVLLINTCAFIDEAKRESIETIIEFANRRSEDGSRIPTVVVGCLPQYYAEKLAEELPEVDVFVGTGFINEIVEAVEAALRGEKKLLVGDAGSLIEGAGRLLATPPYRAYMKIAEGCDNRCSYCVIPRLRGSYRSRRMESLVAEAEKLARSGVRELTLVAQDTTSYGIDLGDASLPALLKRLSAVEGLEWIRAMYLHPLRIGEELLEAFAVEAKVCKYMDIPVQHSSENLLARMGRRGSSEEFLGILERIRSTVPDVTLRTTFMVGFPGETEKDVEELIDFLKEAKFDYAGVFAFSPQEDTPAFHMPGQVPEKEKRMRRRAVIEAQREVSRQTLSRWVGREVDMLVESVLPSDGGWACPAAAPEAGVARRSSGPLGATSRRGDFIAGPRRRRVTIVGRTRAQAPEVDGITKLKWETTFGCSAPCPSPGDIVRALIQRTGPYDLYGKPIID